jgi:hypothetical protein
MTMPTMTLTLTVQDAIALVNLLGTLPTSQGVFPLYANLFEQVQGEVNKPKLELADAVQE